MIQIISYLVWLLNNLWALAIVIVVVAILLVLFRTLSGRPLKESRIPAAAVLLLLVFLPIFFFVRSYITSPLIYFFGQETVGRVVGVESVPEMYNERQVYRHNVIFYNEADELIETSFKTSDFNVYPISNYVSYPGAGQEFHLRYLSHAPSEFVILRDTSGEQLTELWRERSVLVEKLDFAPDEEKFLLELEEIDQKILELEQAKEEKQQVDYLIAPVEDYIFEIEDVEGVDYNATNNMALIVGTYRGIDSFSQDALLFVSLSDQTIEKSFLLDSFQNFLGISDNAFYIYDWGKDVLLAYSIDTFDSVEVPASFMEIEREPFLVGDYLLEYNSNRPSSNVYHLQTGEEKKLASNAVSSIIRDGDWHLLTVAQRNDRIQTILSLHTVADFRQYFSDTLANEALLLEHSHADSGLFFSNEEEEVDTMTYLKASDILFRYGAQQEFSQQLSSNMKKKVVGIDDDGTIYGLTLTDEELVGLKKSPSGEMMENPISSAIGDLDFESVHFEEYILLLHQDGLFQLSKEDLSFKQIIDFEIRELENN